MATHQSRPALVDAFQLTQAMVEAHLFDGVNLPEAVRIGRANYHRVRREISFATFYCGDRGDEFSVEVGDWIVRDASGKTVAMTAPDFARLYEPIPAPQQSKD